MPVAVSPELNRIERLCIEHGLRMTGQRRIIAKVLADAHDHPDVEEVYRRAHAVDAGISLSTVNASASSNEREGSQPRSW